MSPLNDNLFARREILSRPPDDPGRKFLERLESERKQKGRDREDAARGRQAISARKYACQAGHVMRADEMDTKRTSLGCCPKCATIDLCQPFFDDEPPVKADFDHDPALQADPEAEKWEKG